MPLLAQTDNHDGLLKPGMFVRILLDSPTTERALTIPTSAVIDIEGKTAVFIPSPASAATTAERRAFTLRPVEIGREVGDRVVVKTGIKESESIVASGAYLLKSELLLQSQAEED